MSYAKRLSRGSFVSQLIPLNQRLQPLAPLIRVKSSFGSKESTHDHLQISVNPYLSSPTHLVRRFASSISTTPSPQRDSDHPPTHGSPTQPQIPPVLAITPEFLVRVGVVTSIPYMVFGFADNSLMILFGEIIEASIGVKLGLSTMASAALGNLVSDAIGIGIGKQVEGGLVRFPILNLSLSDEQRNESRIRRSIVIGSVIGICVGCLLGMWPLLFVSEDDDKDDEKDGGKSKVDKQDKDEMRDIQGNASDGTTKSNTHIPSPVIPTISNSNNSNNTSISVSKCNCQCRCNSNDIG